MVHVRRSCLSLWMHPRDWDEYLDKDLWACKRVEKRSTGFFPYHLVYCKEAVVPLEVMLPSLQFYQRHVGSVEE